MKTIRVNYFVEMMFLPKYFDKNFQEMILRLRKLMKMFDGELEKMSFRKKHFQIKLF